MRMRHFLITVAAAAASASGALAQEQEQEQAEGSKRSDLVQEIEANFSKIDTDSDGTVTKPEIAAAQEAMLERASAAAAKKFEEEFRKLDTNKDSMLNLSEFTAAAPEARAKASAESRLDRFDADQDGKITLDEFRTPVLANFDRVDANKDGVLTLEEKRKALAQRGR